MMPMTALDFAVQFRCTDSVRLLLDVNCPWQGFHKSWPLPLQYSDETIACIAQTLAHRRVQLLDLAKSVLQEETLQQFDHIATGVPDLEASTLVHLIEETGVSVPDALAVPPNYEGIYHSGSLTAHCFPIFFESGFRAINSPDRYGLLPIMSSKCFLSFPNNSPEGETEVLTALQWLEARSCLSQVPTDPSSAGLNTSATGRHYLVLRFLEVPFFSFSYSDWIESARRALRWLINADTVDCCHCPCSLRGCLPLTIYFKTAARGSYPAEALNERLLWDIVEGYTAEFLRFLTFELLEMTHTCCNIGTVNFSGQVDGSIRILEKFRGDVSGIRREETELGRRLEDLVAEFLWRFQTSQESLKDFIFGYWRERMREECIPSLKDIKKAEAVGVRPDYTCELA